MDLPGRIPIITFSLPSVFRENTIKEINRAAPRIFLKNVDPFFSRFAPSLVKLSKMAQIGNVLRLRALQYGRRGGMTISPTIKLRSYSGNRFASPEALHAPSLLVARDFPQLSG
jgi:hypothetical protein